MKTDCCMPVWINRIHFYNAPSTFQRLMERMFGVQHFHTLLLYVNYVIVFSSSVEQHLERLDAGLSAITVCAWDFHSSCSIESPACRTRKMSNKKPQMTPGHQTVRKALTIWRYDLKQPLYWLMQIKEPLNFGNGCKLWRLRAVLSQESKGRCGLLPMLLSHLPIQREECLIMKLGFLALTCFMTGKFFDVWFGPVKTP